MQLCDMVKTSRMMSGSSAQVTVVHVALYPYLAPSLPRTYREETADKVENSERLAGLRSCVPPESL